MMLKIFSKSVKRRIASIVLLALVFQLAAPIGAHALTSGPTQPEMQGFEPVGTTDMVDLFSGDFNYNIPLMDIDGYPINIAYHGGVTMEQEASWVGLGWSLNPGEINRSVRGIPDDFDGDEVKKTLEIAPEKTMRFGAFVGAEFLGMEGNKLTAAMKLALKDFKLSGSTQVDFGITTSNYTGVSASIGQNSTISLAKWISPGISMGTVVSTSDGASVDYSLQLSTAISKTTKGSVSLSGSISTAHGIEQTSLGVGVSTHLESKSKGGGQSTFRSGNSASRVPIGLQNYVPVITNATYMKSIYAQLKVGGEVYMIYPYGGGSLSTSEVGYETDGTRNAYGYFHLDNGGEEALKDFARDRDGRINRKSKFLPLSNMTYDIFSVSGQGTGGSFRGFRNDIGTINDPLTGSHRTEQSHLGEVGIGNLIEIGYDLKVAYTQAKSGAWGKHRKNFSKRTNGNLAEPFYLKQAGELSQANSAFLDAISGKSPLNYGEVSTLLNNSQLNTMSQRTPRSSLLYFLTGEDASLREVSLNPTIKNYNFDGFINPNSQASEIPRHTETGIRKKHHASEFTQVLPDGRRYIYGLPALNIVRKDYQISTAPQQSEGAVTTEVSYTAGAPGETTMRPVAYDNPNGLTPKHYSCTETPAYAHSFLLTDILSADYTDLTGNGISDDDLGSYTKFNYRKREDYVWRAPYETNLAYYDKGVRSNCHDDKASFSTGKRENWYLHSIESKTHVLEFFTSPREDGLGSSNTEVLDGTTTTNSQRAHSYKLDSIVLYNRLERKANPTGAFPIKKVVFNYDYSLCKGLPNANSNLGKLTLKSIFVKYGNSDMGFLSPYRFDYNGDLGASFANPVYNLDSKDCWGSFKASDANQHAIGRGLTLNNHEFPYVAQHDDAQGHNLADQYAGAWNLKQVYLPSGGSIKVVYEADDYAYVQDQPAAEMFRIEGMGPNTDFNANNTLYQNFSDPHLYLYFKRQPSKELYPGDIFRSYLREDRLVQYNCEVEVSSGTTSTCTGTALVNNVKGYAEITESGICSNDGSYAYIKIAPKTANNLPGMSGLGKDTKINPISLAAINFARYYDNRSLKPEAEFTSLNPGTVINQMLSSLGSYINFFENPLKSFLKDQKANKFTIAHSFMRLKTPGMTKKGGGHRVKQIEFQDDWEGSSSHATYGSRYDYTTIDKSSDKVISSGVASYEPQAGGDENPCRNLINTQESGNKTKFPPVDPIELLEEGPIGEGLYPSASVGYSKVSISSIHKAEGESSQVIQETEYYTAMDFPARVVYNDINKVEDRKPSLLDIINRKDIYRVSQGYALYFNDMHGKMKKQTTWVDKNNNTTPSRELVSFVEYEYFKKSDGSLDNMVSCIDLSQSLNGAPVIAPKTLGEEVDFTADSREKEEVTNTFTCQLSTNGFLAPPVPIYIPTVFPGFKKQTNTFSSLVTTKVIQQYGILKSVRTYDKGAVRHAENTVFDPMTGNVVMTRVNTGFNDFEYDVKYPAYWAYTNMGAAYENILYEEEVGNAFIKDHKLYVGTPNIGRFNAGDEVIFTSDEICGSSGSNGAKFKLWVTEKNVPPPSPVGTVNCLNNNCGPTASNQPLYKNIGNSSQCLDFNQLKISLFSITHDPYFSSMPTPEMIVINSNPVNYTWQCENGLPPEECIADLNGRDLYDVPPPQNNIVPTYNFGPTPTSGIYVAQVYNSSSGLFTSSNTKTVKYKIHFQRYWNKEDHTSFANCINDWNHNVPISDHGQPMEISMVFPDNGNNLSFSPAYRSDAGSAEYIPGQNGFFPIYARSTTIIPYPNMPWWQQLSTHLLCHHRELRSFVKEYATVDVGLPKPRNPANPNFHLVLQPLKTDVTALNSGYVWPQEGRVRSGRIKVIRSGKRNQLDQLMQELSLLTNPIQNNSLKVVPTANVIAASVTSFTGTAQGSDIQLPNYNNPFSKGERGNYRPEAEYFPMTRRDYNSSGMNSDAQRGVFKFSSPFWNYVSVQSDPEFNKFSSPYLSANAVIPNQTFWGFKGKVACYSPWGGDLVVQDANGNVVENVMGYGNRMVVATILRPAGIDGGIAENFEDYAELPAPGIVTPVTYYQNKIRKDIRQQLSPNLVGSSIQITTSAHHTGLRALEYLQPQVGLSLPIVASYSPPQPQGNLKSFQLIAGQKYTISFWQQVLSSTNVPLNAALVLNMPGLLSTPKAVTPSIDGWVMYQSEFTVPVSAAAGSAILANISPVIVDDLRIVPVKANMKAYVYHPVTRKLIAILDENNFSAIMEYSAEGKLVRIKKETEKGIITLKEARESMVNALRNPAGGTLPFTPASFLNQY